MKHKDQKPMHANAAKAKELKVVYPVADEDYDPTPEDLIYDGSFPVREMYSPNSPYSIEDKVKVLSAYLVCGNSKKTAKVAKVPASTIRLWTRQPWWEQGLQAARVRLDRQMTAKMHDALDKSLNVVTKGLEEGKDTLVGTKEYVEIDEETGLPMKVKENIYEKKDLPAKEAAWVAGIMFDKVQMIQGKPTSRTETTQSPTAFLEELKSEMIKLSKNQRVVSEQDGTGKEN